MYVGEPNIHERVRNPTYIKKFRDRKLKWDILVYGILSWGWGKVSGGFIAEEDHLQDDVFST